LVFSWLKTSLKQHNLGLTLVEWEEFWNSLSEDQQNLLTAFKEGQTVAQVAQSFDITQKQATSKWAELYLLSQETRLLKANAK
ncbi:MAG: hypothetical protein AAFQ63_24150, partial [Cyanobacteria bacterium J06621_11]